MKLTLAMVVPRYRVHVQSGAHIDRIVRVAMSPKAGVPMILSPQERRIQAAPIMGAVEELKRAA
jgi:hypothetical protein